MRWSACRALARRIGLQPAPIEADDHTAEPAKTTMTRTVRAGTRTRLSVPKTEMAPRGAASGRELPRQGGAGDIRSRASDHRPAYPGCRQARISRLAESWRLEGASPDRIRVTTVGSQLEADVDGD